MKRTQGFGMAAAGIIGILISFSGANAAEPEAPRRLALLVGIDDYKYVTDLRGGVNDVELVRATIAGRYGFASDDVLVIRNRQATRAAILHAFREHLIAKAESGDAVLFHFSGHGSQVPDEKNGDEIDGWDETLVAHDSREPGVREVTDITDDEINALLDELTRKTSNITVVLDSCHSGSATRFAGSTGRWVVPDAHAIPRTSARDIKEDTEFRSRGADYVLISGSQPAELSNESVLGGQSHGALTYFLMDALRSSGSRTTYKEMMLGVRDSVSARFPSQHPTLEGGTDRLLFGAETVSARHQVLVHPSGNGKVKIDGGATVGIAPGARLDVFASLIPQPDEKPSATVTVESAEPFSAAGRVTKGTVTARSRAIVTQTSFGTFKANVWIDPKASAREIADLSKRLKTFEQAREVTDERTALLRVTRAHDVWELQSADQVLLALPIPATAPDASEQVTTQITKWARWHAIQNLSNSASAIEVGLELKRAGDPDYSSPPSELLLGAKLTIKMTNRSSQDLYLTLLDLSTSGGISVLYPVNAGAQEAIPAGRSKEITRPVGVREGFNSVTDTVKLIATTHPLDSSVFAQEPARSVDLDPSMVAANAAPLQTLMSLLAVGGAREISNVPLDDWVTRHTSVTVKRPSARAAGIALIFDQPVVDTNVASSLSSAARALCGDAPGDAANCVSVRPLSNDGTIVQVQTAASRGTDATSTGQAFDEAYELREQSGARRAEPLLEVPMPGIPEATDAGTRGGGGDNHDPLSDDERWSLKYVAAAKAQEAVRVALNRPEGEEAKGIYIAHPDTGFTTHPEMQGAVNASAGRDYFDSDDDATDPLVNYGPLTHPGHGTASGSVIVSPSGRQIPGTGPGVYGVASGAALVPLRVNTSVVVFDQRRLAQAIDDAANQKFSAHVSLISIAMGGPPSWTLWRAVRQARRQGVILIAAAGNYVRTVVWPARFDDAIAVAAINAKCAPWTHSSFGSAVDISSPGESVWRATVGDQSAFDIGRGKGTTFATGTTAGIAALWVARHEGTDTFKELRSSGELTDTFRSLLQSTSWRPGDADELSSGGCNDATWNSRLYGQGIVNGERLLAAPLIQAQRALRVESTIDQLPLYSSIYPTNTPYAVVEQDYIQIFGGPRENRTTEDIAIYEAEVMNHYIDAELTAALDAVANGARGVESINRVRQLLLGRILSSRLRAALR